MTMDYSRYPADWKAISRRIRERAGWRCAWCQVANGAVGARDRHNVWHDEADIHSLSSDHGDYLFGPDFPAMVRIVLTVHHLVEDKLDCRDEVLVALCQRCHLNADRPHHLAVQRENRERRKREQEEARLCAIGQGRLAV